MGTIWKEDSVCLKDCPEEALCTPDVLPANSFFCSSLTLPPPNYYFLTLRPQAVEISANAVSVPSNTLFILVSLSQMQMWCTFLTHFAW